MTKIMNGTHIPKAVKNKWEINVKELEFLKEVGQGASALVYKGTYRQQPVAIKVLKNVTPREQADVEKELEVMMDLGSTSIVLFYGMCFSPQACMVLEWCPKGSLFDVLQDKSETMDWPKFFQYSKESVQGIACLHDWNPVIVHRDFKSQNLLVSSSGNLKVCDFGLARTVQDTPMGNQSTLSKLRGTFQYTAPEIYNQAGFTPKADIYSTAVILWEIVYKLITGDYLQPFSEFPHLVFDFQIIIQVAKNDLRPTIPPTAPPAVQNLIKACWNGDHEKRPTAQQLLIMIGAVQSEYEANKAAWDVLVKK
jgi:serine/threonine protein kinase